MTVTPTKPNPTTTRKQEFDNKVALLKAKFNQPLRRP